MEELRSSVGATLKEFHSANVTEDIRSDLSRLCTCFRDRRHQGH